MTDVAEGEAPKAERREPPKSTRFVKGRSGNPRGRPRHGERPLPYEAILGQIVTIREDGRERRLNAAEAFLLHVTKQGLEGDGSAARAAMAAIEQARAERSGEGAFPYRLIFRFPTEGRVNNAMRALRMAVKHDPLRDTARMSIEPWVIKAALARLGDRRLSPEEQAVVFNVARGRNSIKWPEWWEVFDRAKS